MQIPLFLRVVVEAASVIKPRVPTCSDITIPVSIHAENRALPATLSAQELETLVNSLGSSLFTLGTNIIDKTYNIAATLVSKPLPLSAMSNQRTVYVVRTGFLQRKPSKHSATSRSPHHI